VHATCPACNYALAGTPGAPDGALEPFKADVTCPECGATYLAGTLIIVGASQPLAAIRGRSFLARIGLSIGYGGGCGATMLHVAGAFSLSLVVAAAMDIVQGGMRYRSGPRLFFLIVAVCVLVAVGRWWWRRRRVAADDGIRADERDRVLIVGPSGVRDGTRDLSAREVRGFRVHECMSAVDGRTVVAVRATGTTDLGLSTYTFVVHVAIPAGSTHRFADSLNALVRGRTAPADPLPDELSGSRDLPRFNRRWMSPVVGLLMAIDLMLAVVVNAWVLLAIPVLVLPLILAAENPPGAAVLWRFSPHALVQMFRVPSRPIHWYRDSNVVQATMFEFGVSVPLGSLRSLELRESHGMPYLVVRRTYPWRRSLVFVPDDWLGIEPRAFAQAVADRLRVMFVDKSPG
jgi:hypothetical protein